MCVQWSVVCVWIYPRVFSVLTCVHVCRAVLMFLVTSHVSNVYHGPVCGSVLMGQCVWICPYVSIPVT